MCANKHGLSVRHHFACCLTTRSDQQLVLSCLRIGTNAAELIGCDSVFMGYMLLNHSVLISAGMGRQSRRSCSRKRQDASILSCFRSPADSSLYLCEWLTHSWKSQPYLFWAVLLWGCQRKKPSVRITFLSTNLFASCYKTSWKLFFASDF